MSEHDESFAFQNFDTILRQVMAELGVSRMVTDYRIMADPDAPYFLISLRLGKARSSVKISNMAMVDPSPAGAKITITDEMWAPALLALLWQEYGRDAVEQLTRFEIIVHGASAEDLESMELDPGEELKSKVLDAVWRIFPEGFKVRHNLVDDKVMTIIGTEHDLRDEWIKIAEDLHERMHHDEEGD
ncbi:MAG: methanogenesis marker 17 protein [Methanomassiliicoccaceae archaeon]|jgi:putative methanogenesis marker protein 17|nr:methanogenesis marker 17 protein [Methanomassiliicoccaceae archaeon]HPP44242.1 methanogenesis marker 17 protein [Methanomassiliicoccaceae archaeon]